MVINKQNSNLLICYLLNIPVGVDNEIPVGEFFRCLKVFNDYSLLFKTLIPLFIFTFDINRLNKICCFWKVIGVNL